MSWVYVIVGIVCLIALQFLRGALSMAFPRYTARPIQRPDEVSFGGLELIDAKSESLAALGFSGPAWVGADPGVAEASGVNAHAVFRNAKTGVVAWLGPTIELAHPNSLLTYYTTLLTDGRFAVTQVSDPYFAAVDDPKTPAQTIEGSDEASEIAAHEAFVASLGVPVARSTPRQDVIAFAGEHLTALRQRLIERGKLRESQSTARPSVGFALRILGKMLSRPKPAAAGELAVPTSRLPFLANMVELQKKRAPSQEMQWLLLLISAALFVGIGWPLLGLEFTLIILAVIVFHEGGHWFAMRLYGYENPHITLLPLLGGVTIGHENDPSANKRAWVALAGPLPGIILGWGLLAYSMSSPTDIQFMGTWVFSAIIVLLFVNYLNILPIPPLDGAHVAQAILPPRWSGVQAFVIVLGVVLGVYVAYLLDFWPLALIAALQLPAIKGMLRTAKLVREYAGHCPDGDDAMRRAWLFEELEKKLGSPKAAAKRIGLANTILHTLAVEPMRAGHRFIVSAVYLALLIVPVGALMLTLMVASDDAYDSQFNDELSDIEFERIAEEASRLDIITLVDALADDQGAPPPADATTRLAVEARLGRPLPAQLAAFYDVADGLPGSLGLLPLEQVRLVDATLLESGDLSYYVLDGSLYFYDETAGDLQVSVDEARDWWQVGHNEEWLSRVFVDPDAESGQPAVFQLGEETAAYTSISDLLRREYEERRYADVYEEQAIRVETRQRERLRGMTTEELMLQFRKPGLLERIITGEYLLPGPADEATLDAAESRIGRRLPDDHRAALGVYNGYTQAMLLSADAIQPAGNIADSSIEYVVEIGIDAGYADFSRGHLDACLAVGGHYTRMPDDELEQLYATLLWCPDLPVRYRYLSTVSQSYFPTFRDALFEYAVQMTSY